MALTTDPASLHWSSYTGSLTRICMGSPGAKPAKEDSVVRERSDRRFVLNQSSSVYAIDAARRLVRVRFAKKLRFSDIESYVQALRADPRFNPRFSELVDLRGVEEVALSSQHQIKLADQVDPFAPTSKRAFVVRSQEHSNAAHIHRMLRPESSSIRVFFSTDEAENWIKNSGPDR